METEQEVSRERSGPVGGGRFAWWSFALWLPGCLLLGVAVAWAAVVAESYFAPMVIFPLLVGVGLGAILVGLMRLGQVGNRLTVLLGTVLAMAVTVAGQHYLSYRAACERTLQDAEEYRIAKQAFPEEFKDRIPEVPTNFAEYMCEGRDLPWGGTAEGWIAWLTWVVDGLLVFVAALAMVVPAMRQPYCIRCRSWYHATRSGRIDVATARRLAKLAQVPTVDRSAAARYRILNCNGGCGPTGFDLSWDKSPRGTCSVRVWLGAECRNRIAQVLDEATVADSRR